MPIKKPSLLSNSDGTVCLYDFLSYLLEKAIPFKERFLAFLGLYVLTLFSFITFSIIAIRLSKAEFLNLLLDPFTNLFIAFLIIAKILILQYYILWNIKYCDYCNFLFCAAKICLIYIPRKFFPNNILSPVCQMNFDQQIFGDYMSCTK